MIIQKTIEKIQERIHAACLLANRDPHAVKLLAVSKTQSADTIRMAYSAGQRAFGENYVQEALQKIELLGDLPDIEWHLIGPLQSNKSRVVAKNFAWVHSVDSLKLAERLSAQRPANLPPLQICLQINISQEPAKSGIAPEDALALAKKINVLPHVQLRGLMCIPAANSDPALSSAPFRQLQQLLHACQAEGLYMDTLSMGMSADMEQAIAAGATIVRVGSAIFGERKPQQPLPSI